MSVFKPDQNFDGLAPTTTKGDLIARDTNENVRIPVGADGLFLEANSGYTGGIRWGSPGGALAYFSVGGATTLPQLNTFYAMNASAAAFSVTLPVSGSTGSVLSLKKVDVTLNGITLVGPIDGASLYNLATINEEINLRWDGSAYKIETHYTQTLPVNYSPGFTAFGTVTGASLSIATWRDGRFLNVSGYFIVGTPAASAAAMSIGFGGTNAPAGVLVDTSALGGTLLFVGQYVSKNTNATSGYMLNLSGATQVGFGQSITNAGAPPGQQANGNGIGGAGNSLNVTMRIPISGWQP